MRAAGSLSSGTRTDVVAVNFQDDRPTGPGVPGSSKVLQGCRRSLGTYSPGPLGSEASPGAQSRTGRQGRTPRTGQDRTGLVRARHTLCGSGWVPRARVKLGSVRGQLQDLGLQRKGDSNSLPCLCLCMSSLDAAADDTDVTALMIRLAIVAVVR